MLIIEVAARGSGLSEDEHHYISNKMKHVAVNYLDLFLKKFIGYDEVKADFQMFMLEQKKSAKMKEQVRRRRSSRDHVVMSKFNPIDFLLDIDPVFIWICVGLTICGILICVYFCCNPCASDEEEKKEGEGEKAAVVKQKVRLDNRIIDLRVPTNQAIFKLQSGVCRLYRQFMMKNNFVEIHSPKMIGGASEGGANVFQFEYFGQPACLAQSPQLYKQMALCADFDRVFEIGPVFRAEDSNTNRHLCEFTGLDMEMTIKEHYFEVLDMLADLLVHIFNGIETEYAKELEVIKQQYPFEPFVCKTPVVKLHFKDGVKMLHEAGIQQGALEDLSTEAEKTLGRIVKEKYGTDFYMLYGYPQAVRPFYTMVDPHDPDYTNSYDFFMRGEEITSGAQRIHDPEMLTERAKGFGIPVETLRDYIDSFKYGAPAHGGAGFGLERIVKFYCNLHNIRKSSLFPRDPKRIVP